MIKIETLAVLAANVALNLTAYTDTMLGIELRCWMVLPVQKFDVTLAAYIVENVHF